MLRSLNFWLFLLLLVCMGSFWAAAGEWHPLSVLTGHLDPVPSQEKKDEPPAQPVHLRILNGTDRSGLARQVSLQAARQGCVVEGIGNSPGRWPETLLVNRRLSRARAMELASRLGAGGVITQWDDGCTEDAELILGEDFKAREKTPR